MGKLLYIIMLALITVSVPAFSQYGDADSLMLQYRKQIGEASARLEVDPLVVESVVYPEVVRYSALQDEIERLLVHGVYVRFGLSQGDFSIGVFQMKPSFVESLERRWNLADTLPSHYLLYFSTMNRSEFSRSQRIRKMTSVEGQCLYAAVFVKLMEHCLDVSANIPDAAERVRLMATAYNRGVVWDVTTLDEIEKWSHKASFHTDMIATPFTEYCRYGDIAVEHYNFLNK